jgi:hypothetical protein
MPERIVLLKRAPPTRRPYAQPMTDMKPFRRGASHAATQIQAVVRRKLALRLCSRLRQSASTRVAVTPVMGAVLEGPLGTPSPPKGAAASSCSSHLDGPAMSAHQHGELRQLLLDIQSTGQGRRLHRVKLLRKLREVLSQLPPGLQPLAVRLSELVRWEIDMLEQCRPEAAMRRLRESIPPLLKGILDVQSGGDSSKVASSLSNLGYMPTARRPPTGVRPKTADSVSCLLRGDPPLSDAALSSRHGRRAIPTCGAHPKEGVASLLRDAAHPLPSDAFDPAPRPVPRSAWTRAGVVDNRENYPIRRTEPRGINGGRPGEY